MTPSLACALDFSKLLPRFKPLESQKSSSLILNYQDVTVYREPFEIEDHSEFSSSKSKKPDSSSRNDEISVLGENSEMQMPTLNKKIKIPPEIENELNQKVLPYDRQTHQEAEFLMDNRELTEEPESPLNKKISLKEAEPIIKERDSKEILFCKDPQSMVPELNEKKDILRKENHIERSRSNSKSNNNRIDAAYNSEKTLSKDKKAEKFPILKVDSLSDKENPSQFSKISPKEPSVVHFDPSLALAQMAKIFERLNQILQRLENLETQAWDSNPKSILSRPTLEAEEIPHLSYI